MRWQWITEIKIGLDEVRKRGILAREHVLIAYEVNDVETYLFLQKTKKGSKWTSLWSYSDVWIIGWKFVIV